MYQFILCDCCVKFKIIISLNTVLGVCYHLFTYFQQSENVNIWSRDRQNELSKCKFKKFYTESKFEGINVSRCAQVVRNREVYI